MSSWITSAVFAVFILNGGILLGHCQMPCGIYNDQMVYDRIDEYYQTMYKAVAALENNAFSNVQDRNQFVRWVMQKDVQSDEAAHILTNYFLQQKIKPSNDEDTHELVHVLHHLLFLIVQIKQTVDIDIVKDFGKEWEHFKYLFHPEIECKNPVTVEPKWNPEEINKEKTKEKAEG
ncbi:MAG: superoxide dismutase [Ni] [Chlamydiales bacterium]